MKYSLMPADTYIVINRTILNDHDRKLLVMLYQPIVGSIAINLYFTLWSYLDKTEILSSSWTHHHITNSMGITLSEFISAKEKLEGIGLLKSYVKSGTVNNYVYEMYSPLSAHEFFNNPILNTVLYTNIGNDEYKKVKEYFKVPRINLNGYEDITLKFNEVYESTNLITGVTDDMKKKSFQKLDVITSLDLDNIFSSIPEEMLNIKGITRDMKDLIIKLGFIYDLNDEEMSNIIRNSINERHNIDKELLRSNSRNYYRFEHSGKLPSIVYRNQPEYLRKPVGDTSIRAKIIYQFETTSPYDFLSSKYGGAKPTKTDLALLEYLLIDLNLNPGVVNVLIDYVLKINNNKLTRAFIDTIAGQWKRNKIETVEDAMNLASKEQKGRKIKSSTKKIEEKPTWFDEDIKATNDSEKQKELEELLKEFR